MRIPSLMTLREGSFTNCANASTLSLENVLHEFRLNFLSLGIKDYSLRIKFPGLSADLDVDILRSSR